jgi:hypothetical protein
MANQAPTASSRPQFSIARVLRTSLSIVLGNPLKFCAAPALLLIPLLVLVVAVGYGVFTDALPALQMGKVRASGVYLAIIVVFLLIIVWSSVTSAVLVSVTFQTLHNKTARLGVAFKRGWGALIPVSVTALIVALILVLVAIVCLIPASFLIWAAGALFNSALFGLLTMIVCLVPITFVAMIFWLFTPAIVVEGKGIGSSLGRSLELTRGHR